ncbi:hypothetical protein Tco_1511364 [Tanacetum coccineum]
MIEPPKLELKELPEHIEYAFIQGDGQLPVVISSALSALKKIKLLEVLKNHKGAIAWSIADIKGIDSSFCTHKILMEDDFKLTVQPQRRVNPNIKKVVNKEVVKLLDAGLIYPISDSPWLSAGALCIDYRRLNDITRKDHFPLPFIDQMLERLAGHEYYYFLDGFSDSMEVFMEDFFVFGSSFDHCLENLEKMLKRCEETFVLNWEKCHFMVKEGIVLGHKVFGSGIAVD